MEKLLVILSYALTTLDQMEHTHPIWGEAAARFDHRTEVSHFYTLDKSIEEFDVIVLQQILANVSADPESVTAGKNAINGQLDAIVELSKLDGEDGFHHTMSV